MPVQNYRYRPTHGDDEHTHPSTPTLPPYEAHQPMAVDDTKKSAARPLPRVPTDPPPLTLSSSESAPAHVPRRRRASGGSFSIVARPKVATRPTLPFFVCNRNENDSPLSPATPFHARHFPRAPTELPVLTIPMSPLVPLTPGFVHMLTPSPLSAVDSSQVLLLSPAMVADPVKSPATLVRLKKRHGRHGLGTSLGSISADVLAELRRLGDGGPRSPGPLDDFESPDPTSTDEDSDYGEENSSEELVFDPPASRFSVRSGSGGVDLVEEWISQRYSTALEAL